MSEAAIAAGIIAPASVAAMREAVHQAVAQQCSLRIAGASTWLQANRPVRATTVLSTSALTGIVEYVPGDLTLTARAGTSLADIDRVTAEYGQWLTLDPFGSTSATLGATIATASSGPLAHHFGTPRDVVLGVEFVSGTGALVRGGGRVVKNVAGFDLTRLVTGAWGSLGVLTEMTVRLRALPEQTVTIAVDVADTAERMREIWSRLRRLPFVPFAAELLDGTLAKRVGVEGGGAAATSTLLIRVGGNTTAVRAQREQLRELGTIRETDEHAWDRLRSVEPTRAAVVRWSALPSRFAETWVASTRVAQRWPGTLRHGDPGRGVVRCILPLDALAIDGTATDALRSSLDSPFTGTRISERLPADLWPLCAPSRVADRISQDVRRAFDPHRVLNPGILGEVA